MILGDEYGRKREDKFNEYVAVCGVKFLGMKLEGKNWLLS